MWVPIYKKDGNEFFIREEEFAADEEWEATKIGFGSMLVECVLLGTKFVRVQEINEHNIPHVTANLADYPIAIISGPLFDAAHEEE